ncbi:MAG: ATP-dependent RNA helicase HrpA [Phycisphaerales bacterium]|nr:ATP-dependent RNA helicase HrpA [Phycisphaerales bacterium]
MREIAAAIDSCLIRDRRRFRRRLRRLKGRGDVEVRGRGLEKLAKQVKESLEAVDRRRQVLVKQEFAGDLPILEARAEIDRALADNQVVIICGETGSGKTTQLPRMAMDGGRGLFGVIGHTQPRRLAARAVAQRISDELGPVGPQVVGFQVRFRRQTPPDSIIKVMTDGILLAELADDPRLEQYDTIIVDEAHERSLNIDLLLGCLRRIVAQRPELRVIVTSATIDADRFSTFFGGAPVIEVSGRQYPVDIVHPESGSGPDDPESVSRAVHDAMHEAVRRHPDTGDVLVFLPGEREIREVGRTLQGPFGRDFEIVPLYARLSLAAQQKALRPGARRRIVLSTNVAETSLTVPRIRVVIDSGLARINRYSARRGIERLPVEGISQASAAQRTGRAGRIAPGTCLRLYSEAALAKRDAYTPPEILRTNLAGVILRLADMGLGSVEEFPLLDPPRPQAIRAGLETLHELGALDAAGGLTRVGRSMARMPVDPRLSRMLLAGHEENCLDDVLVIASGLAIPDPRVRPPESEQAADQRHAAFREEGSDFLSMRTLWEEWVKVIRAGGGSSHRRWCQSNFLSWVRMREWREIHDQLHRMLREVGLRTERRDRREVDADAVHRSLLVGLVTNVGHRARPTATTSGKVEKGVYEGPSRRRFRIHPSSGLTRERPPWIMAAELVETTQLWARKAAGIDPSWIGSVAAHLLEPVYGDPEWDGTRGAAMTQETRTLRGLAIPGSRRVAYAKVDADVARRMFIDEGLVRGDLSLGAEFYRHNRQLQEEIERREDRLRRRDLLVSELERAAFYEKHVPDWVVDLASLKRWIDTAKAGEVDALRMKESDLLRRDVAVEEEAFPEFMTLSGVTCAVHYGFEPGSDQDGMCVRVPLGILTRIDPVRLGWLVPGLLPEKIEAVIRGLDKDIRRECQPVADTVDWCRHEMRDGEGPVDGRLAELLTQRSGHDVTVAMVSAVELPPHLQVMIEVVDGETVVGQGRDLGVLRDQLASGAVADFAGAAAAHDLARENQQSWTWGSLFEPVTLQVGGVALSAWTSLEDEGRSVGIRLVPSSMEAVQRSRRGLCRLFLMAGGGSIEFQVEHLPELDRLMLSASPVLGSDHLCDGVALLACEAIYLGDGGPRHLSTREAFESRLVEGEALIVKSVLEVGERCREIFQRRQDVAIVLESGCPPGAEVTWDEEARHLDRLFQPDVLHETPRAWLAQYPRWLDVMTQRLHRARRENGRGLRIEEVDRWEARLATVWRGDATLPAVRQLAWLMEEWRVRHQAPGQPQAVPVTEETLAQQWEVIRMLGIPGVTS